MSLVSDVSAPTATLFHAISGLFGGGQSSSSAPAAAPTYTAPTSLPYDAKSQHGEDYVDYTPPAAAPTAGLPSFTPTAPPPPVYAPQFDTAAINAQSRAAAENNVNPYYTLEMNRMLGQAATEKSQQEAQTKTNIQNLKDTLTNTTDANAVTGARTTEDTGIKEAGINQAADWRQTDQGGQYDMDRVAQAISQAKSGLTGSGIAGGQAGAAQDKFNTTESRQATTDADSKAAAELSKARTFEDLATSNKVAGQSEGKGEAQANVDLNNFIVNQKYNTQYGEGAQSTLEKQRQADIVSETQRQNQLAINTLIQHLSNPAQRQAAYQAYGGAF